MSRGQCWNQVIMAGRFGGSDKRWEKVKVALTELLSQSTYSLRQFDDFFSVDSETGALQIPDSLTEITSDIWATKQISSYVESQSTAVNLRHPFECPNVDFGTRWCCITYRSCVASRF